MRTIRDDVLMALNLPTIKERADRIMFVFDEYTVHAKLNDEHEQLKVKIIELQKELESVYAQDGVKYQTPFLR